MKLRFGLAVKLLGSLVFCITYLFYFKGGDTFLYFKNTHLLVDFILKNPEEGIGLLFSNEGEQSLSTVSFTRQLIFFNAPSEWAFVRLAAIAGLFGFNSYIVITLMFSFLSFLGSWSLFLFFRSRLPNYDIINFAAAFLIPSCLFWTTGLLKDTLCISFVGFILYSIQSLIEKRKVLNNGVLLVVSFFLLFSVKSYIAVSLLIALIFWVQFKLLKRINSPTLKKAVGLVVLIVVVSLATQSKLLFNTIEQQIIFDESIQKIKNYHGEYSDKEVENASYYSLGTLEYDLFGIIVASPMAIVTTLIRPHPWDTSKPLMLLMSAENFFFLLFLGLFVFNSKFWRSIKKVLSNDDIIFCFIFVMVLATIVGLTSYNFGLLMRLKTPILPFYAFGLITIFSLTFPEKQLNSLSDLLQELKHRPVKT